MALFEPNAHLTRPISSFDFDRYLNGIGLKAACVECGQNNWTFMGLDGQQVPSLMIMGPSVSRLNLLGETIPCIVINCNHCGNIRLFGRNVVANWINTHPR